MSNAESYDIGVIKSVKRQTLYHKVYESLKMSILNYDLPPGTKLNEVQLAEQLNVSATPVREAFKMLASEGLVKITPWKGVEVQQFSDTEIIDTFQCREALEILAIELTFDRLKFDSDKEDIIKDLDETIERSKNVDTITEFVYINSTIHDFWLKHSGNKRLIDLMDNLNDVLLHDRNVSAFVDKRKEEIIKEHIEILLALKNMDLEKAKQALRTHIRNGCEFGRKIREEREKR